MSKEISEDDEFAAEEGRQESAADDDAGKLKWVHAQVDAYKQAHDEAVYGSGNQSIGMARMNKAELLDWMREHWKGRLGARVDTLTESRWESEPHIEEEHEHIPPQDKLLKRQCVSITEEKGEEGMATTPLHYTQSRQLSGKSIPTQENQIPRNTLIGVYCGPHAVPPSQPSTIEESLIVKFETPSLHPNESYNSCSVSSMRSPIHSAKTLQQRKVDTSPSLPFHSSTNEENTIMPLVPHTTDICSEDTVLQNLADMLEVEKKLITDRDNLKRKIREIERMTDEVEKEMQENRKMIRLSLGSWAMPKAEIKKRRGVRTHLKLET